MCDVTLSASPPPVPIEEYASAHANVQNMKTVQPLQMDTKCERCQSERIMFLTLRDVYLCGDCEHIQGRSMGNETEQSLQTCAVYKIPKLRIFISCK